MLYNRTGHPILTSKESQWKLRHCDQNFPIEGAIIEQILASEEINKSKRAGL